jgi:hypothetical protein
MLAGLTLLYNKTLIQRVAYDSALIDQVLVAAIDSLLAVQILLQL